MTTRWWLLAAASAIVLVGVPLVLVPFGVTPSPLGWALLGALAVVPLALALRRARRRPVLRARAGPPSGGGSG